MTTQDTKLSNADEAILTQLKNLQKIAADRGIDLGDLPPAIPAVKLAAEEPQVSLQAESKAQSAEKQQQMLAMKEQFAELRKEGYSETVNVTMTEPSGENFARMANWVKKMTSAGFSGELSQDDVLKLFSDPELKKQTDRIIIDSMSFVSYTNCMTALLMAFSRQAVHEFNKSQ